MKSLAAITASVILTATFASVTSANEDITPVQLSVDEPIVKSSEIFFAPSPIDLLEDTFFYESPDGKAWGAISPQKVHPTGNIMNDWVEIYTWLGKAWIYLPNYEISYY